MEKVTVNKRDVSVLLEDLAAVRNEVLRYIKEPNELVKQDLLNIVSESLQDAAMLAASALRENQEERSINRKHVTAMSCGVFFVMYGLQNTQ